MEKPLKFYQIQLEPGKKSKVWDYFGTLSMDNKSVEEEKIFCKLCLMEQKEDDETVIFKCAKVQSYSRTCSTGNLNRHLKNEHTIRDLEATTKTALIPTFFQKSVAQKSTKDKKWMLARDLALWMARDLVPFHMIAHNGIKDFLIKYKVAANDEEIPHRKTLSTTALDDVYESVLKIVKKQVCSQEHFAITFDMWMDNFRRRSYITFTLHFITSNFELENLTLDTKFVEKSHTASTILSELENILEKFNLQIGSNYAVTDQGSNMKRAINLGNINNHFCLGHGLHNLLNVDGFNSVQEIKEIIYKCKRIVSALRYKTHTLRCQADTMQKEILSNIDNLEELLASEEDEWVNYDEDFSPLDDVPLKTYVNINNVHDLRSSLVEKKNVTLKNSVPTRWHSVLAMLESIGCQRAAINKLLTDNNNDSLILLEAEAQLIFKLKEFLQKFKDAVNILSGDKYPSISLALIIRTEIISILDETENVYLNELKNNIKRKLDYRFPITDILVCASLLDPRFCSLDCVQSYCEEKNLTKVGFLTNMYKNLVGDVQQTNDEDVDDEGPSANKILKLVKRHTKNSQKSTLETEIHLLFSLTSCQDILTFWKEKASAMPLLASFAQKVLCIPATSTPSERVFSIAGLTVTNKRSQLSPHNVNKIIFIHDNYETCKAN